jgi:FtsP/CotA-like multicopper oxidase with cupredoxin domain
MSTTIHQATSMKRLLPCVVAGAALWLTTAAHAAAPGISSTGGTAGVFGLTASAASITQPDGQAVYSWGYGCTAGSAPSFLPANITTHPTCTTMQIPGPTLIVTEGQVVTVILTNNLPTAAGNTSILFPGFNVTPSGGVSGLLAQEAVPGGIVTYTFTATTPGTRAYYSGTQGDLQVEMGLYGAIIVLPSETGANYPAANCGTLASGGLPAANPGNNRSAMAQHGEVDFRLAAAAYDHPGTCYDREYLFQFSEMDLNIHAQALAQVMLKGACTAGAVGCSLEVPTEPYHPGYFLINGRSMPDDMDPNYAEQYPHQPYNGNPHMHPGEQTLLRIIGQGRWQHPFHQHGNHTRILGRDGNLITSDPTVATNLITYPGSTTPAPALAGRLEFTTTTTPGQAFDGIFYWTGKGLNWDIYAHNPLSTKPATEPVHAACNPDAYGYNTGDPTAINYYEWCQDHAKPLQVAPFGDVPSGGPATLPDPNVLTNGPWYGGTPYLGPDATVRAVGPTGTTPPSGVVVNPPATEAGLAFMWHSHNEREITTNNIFPGGMLMMMLVDSREFLIDESN